MHLVHFESCTDSGNNVLPHFRSIKNDPNNFISSNLNKIHRLVEFQLIRKALADLRGL